ncbi:hypothetical protein NPIL_316011 [Nephila pilipes]|uniref:Uncharacterized protein n=1 Tax=Nephila pilipes TaxID=299642 RepID=A0A8X6TIE2_NEPPI|nr:hypothetical protein NPIL_316011 [Nephila pilipes]
MWSRDALQHLYPLRYVTFDVTDSVDGTGEGSRDMTSIPEWDTEEQMGGWISRVNLPVPNGDGEEKVAGKGEEKKEH